MFKLIIAGGRDFNNYEFLNKICSYYLKNKSFNDIEIVSGCANGADKLGEKFAIENNIQIIKFPADWEKFGKSAGYVRNTQMADYADALIAFWNGKSKGTKHMIDIAKARNLIVKVINY